MGFNPMDFTWIPNFYLDFLFHCILTPIFMIPFIQIWELIFEFLFPNAQHQAQPQKTPFIVKTNNVCSYFIEFFIYWEVIGVSED